MKRIAVFLGVLLLVLVCGWIGLQVKPAPFPRLAQNQPPLRTVPLPGDLPAPVKRFYVVTYGERIPVVDTAVISGRGRMRLFGLHVPIRFRFTHEVGQNFRHDIELT